jgi:hypothetical protein
MHSAMLKAILLFLGLITKGLAISDPLPFSWGIPAKAVSGIIWPAFDGSLLWLLTPPTLKKETPTDETPGH